MGNHELRSMHAAGGVDIHMDGKGNALEMSKELTQNLGVDLAGIGAQTKQLGGQARARRLGGDRGLGCELAFPNAVRSGKVLASRC